MDMCGASCPIIHRRMASRREAKKILAPPRPTYDLAAACAVEQDRIIGMGANFAGRAREEFMLRPEALEFFDERLGISDRGFAGTAEAIAVAARDIDKGTFG